VSKTWPLPLLGLLCLSALALPWTTAAPKEGPPPRPVALALPEARWLFAADRAGSLAAIDTSALRLVKTSPVGKRLAGLAATPDGAHLLAVDEEAHQLLLLAHKGPAVKVLRRLPVSPYPVTVAVSSPPASKPLAFVASLWSRRLTVIDLDLLLAAKDEKAVRAVLPLPFPPRALLPLDGGKRLLVADAFAGRLALLDVSAGKLLSVRTLPAHNVRGLALAPGGKSVLVAHQTLRSATPTTRDDIHWGNLLTNNVRELSLARVLDPDADLLAGSITHQLDEVRRGAADPSALAVSPTGQILVPLGGMDELLIGPQVDADRSRLPVGRRPGAVVADARRAYVANTLGGSVSVIDLPRHKVLATVPLGPGHEPTLAERGESLFFDARLAHDGWLSCHSCHTDGHTSGLLNDNLSDGSFGAPKRILSLRGVKDTAPYAWNASMPDLESQAKKSALKTMAGPELSDDQARALAAYLRTLPPVPPLGDFDKPDKEAAARGRALFGKLGCARCHAPPTYTTPHTYDVGLADEVGNKRFNPPSLRGVSQRAPYFHDNRAPTLRAVFTRHRHQLPDKLPGRDLKDLLAFLATL
jgi:cytochrome c peroxidase